MSNKILWISLFLLSFLLSHNQVETKSLDIIKRDLQINKTIPFRRLAASSSGVVAFKAPIYAVTVDFTDLSGIFPTPSGDQETGMMGIALYTNESFFGGECKNFIKYECDEPDCSTDPTFVRNISYPYFTFKGYSLHAQLFLDYDFFSSTYMGFTYAQSCYPAFTASSDAIYGYIGLGLDGYNINNFVGSFPTFSVFLEKNGAEGSLIFDCDTTKINSTGYNKAVLTTKNWEITFRDLNLDQFLIPYSGTVIFDLNLPFIGIPESIYTEVLSALQNTFGVVCFDPNIFLDGCVYLGDYLKLPPIEIGNKLQIPAEIYLHRISVKQNTYKLKLIPLSTDEPEAVMNGVKVTPNYQHHIILGSPFLETFYTCFETKPNGYQISIHEKCTVLDFDKNILQLVYVGLSIGIPLAIFSFFMILSCCKKGKNIKGSLNAPLTQEGSIHKNLNGSKSSLNEKGEKDPTIFGKISTKFKNPENFSFAGSILKRQNSV